MPVNWVSIGSDNGLSPIRRQAITWTNADLLSNGPSGTNVNEIWIEILTFSFHSRKCIWTYVVWGGGSFQQPRNGKFISAHSSLAPVPLSIFRSNSKFDENSERSSFKYIRPITTIFCTRHDSDTVVTCAKYRCDRPRIFYTRVFWIFIEFRIRSKYA